MGYRITSLSRRGEKKTDETNTDKVLSVTFPFDEWCKMKVVSVTTGVPIKELLRMSFCEVYGNPTDNDVSIVTGKSIEQIKSERQALIDSKINKKDVKFLQKVLEEKGVNTVATKLFSKRKP
ncbi:MAG: hypothetical protein WCJ40_05850 [Planctomycetota bacterium]